ncbi:uncharacterized protein N7458_010429 [Penicillium daleae]|uniref:Uncharacterized protein n=1 Tax=Penicillium daleae TaxID=63821 RepID=A0AAD6C117_9EURO|nr:uncharacterized protein N7458_010429 [Penicillium daleae]KAJ5439431.1 hypothetical protein N7458_010429 [Penicillium daleae]
MVLLVATDRIIAALGAVPISQRSELDLPSALQSHDPITHEQLLRLAKHLQNNIQYQATTTDEHNHSTILNTLLHGTKVYIPPPPKKPEPSPEYLASKARLLAEAERAAYQRLLNPTYPPPRPRRSPRPLPRRNRRHPHPQLSLQHLPLRCDNRVQTFTSWTGPGGQDGDTGEVTGGASDAVRVLVSFFAALAVAVAEAFLYGAYLEKVSRARAKEKRVKERKVFVGRVGGRGRR